MPYEPIIPDGQHLGTSREADDAVVGHLFDDETNKLKGHAAWRWVDDPDEDYSSNYEDEPPRELTQEELELVEKIVEVILAGIVLAVVAATPHVKRWWNDKALPTAKIVWKRITAPRKAKSQIAPQTSPSVNRVTFVGSATGVEIAIAESKISMSSSEWAQRFRATLAAGAFKDEQLRVLARARIVDSDAVPQAQRSVEPLTPQEFADRLRLMLEARPLLLNEENSRELMRIFGAQPTSSRNQRGRKLGQ